MLEVNGIHKQDKWSYFRRGVMSSKSQSSEVLG